jgi:hypothetical protein
MRKHLSILIALSIIGLTAGVAFAQTRPLTCSDFKRNPNGSWSPLVGITLNGVTMGPGVSFTPGVSFGGVDLASILNQKCPA